MSVNEYVRVHSFKNSPENEIQCRHYLDTVTFVEAKAEWFPSSFGIMIDQPLAYKTCPHPVCSCQKHRMGIK